MVAPPEVPRNAQQGKVQAALQGDGGCSAANSEAGCKTNVEGLVPRPQASGTTVRRF